jgi:hypothetical protein
MAATAPYTWKSTDELDKKNQANATAKVMAGASAQAFGAPPVAAVPPPPGAGGGLPDAATSTAAPSAGVSAFAMPRTMAAAMRQPGAPATPYPAPTLDSNMELAQKNIADGFGPLPTGPADALARNQLQKTIDAGGTKVAEQSTLAGRGATGQRGGDLVNFYQTSAIPAKAELEGKLQANRMDEERTRQQASQQNLQALAGQASSEKVALAGQASGEKIAFAQLSQADKELAQKASQFKDQLEWDKEATKLGLDDKTAERAWQSSENLKATQAKASESALDRELQKYLGDKGLNLDSAKLAETVREFDTKEDFDKWATQAGLDNDAADRVWKSNEADVERKWNTGERMGAEEAQVNLTRLQAAADTDKLKFQQVLNIQTMEKQAEIDKVTTATANEYQSARDTRMMSHDEAMEVLKSSLTDKLQQAGYDHETAMQAASIQADAFQKDQDRQAAKVEAQAELAYKYKALADQSGLSQQEIDQHGKELEQNLSLGLKQLGLDETKINAAITSDQFKERQGIIATMMELGGDNPAVMDRAATAFVNLLSDPTLPGGALVSPEDKAKMIAAIGKTPTPSKPGEWSLDNSGNDIVNGSDNLMKGNILTGSQEFYSGTLGAPYSLVRDATHGIRKVGDWIGL